MIGAVQKLGLFLMFRPLDGLLGAYVPIRALSGMLVTTKRDLHVQRFTAAHELGHHLLEHRTLSLDTVVGFVGRGEASKHDPQEVEADAFAAEFLLPEMADRGTFTPPKVGTPTHRATGLRLSIVVAA